MPITTEQTNTPRRSKTLRVPIPPGRDPFVNTPLLALGCDGGGEERFWISTWNHGVGCLGALVTAAGVARIYRFDTPRHAGFYSAAAEDADTLWLCGDLSRVVRLTLSTGDLQEFATGAPSALVFQGMILDPATGKLFAAAFPYSTTTAFSFDFRRGEPVKVYEDISPAKYLRFSFPNGDGTYSGILHIPGEALFRWDPRAETIDARPLADSLDSECLTGGTTYRLIEDGLGCRYFPGRGWYDARARTFATDGPRPQREMTWFTRRGHLAWGCDDEQGNTRVGVWDLSTGSVHDLCVIPDCSLLNVNLTDDEKLLAVNLFGDLYRFDGHSGALELSRRLPTDSYGVVDCLRRIDDHRLLGTPFITQRFWEINLKTKQGYDCGRAAPGSGEVLQTWKIGAKIYMAAYTGAELVEYDPAQHPHFPENPRVVADPPHGMRPVAAADDGRRIFYACSAEYGLLGSVLTKYDTVTGEAHYLPNPLPDQQVQSLCYDGATNNLFCGTTMHADCWSCPPTADRCYFARIDADTLCVTAQAPAPAGTSVARVLGPLDDERCLCACNGAPDGLRWFVLDNNTFTVPDLEAMTPFPTGLHQIIATGKPGMFVLHIDDRLELWDYRTVTRVALLRKHFTGYRFHVQDETVYLVYPKEIIVLEGCLAGYME